MEPIRLVIADDHTFYREGIRTILHMVAGIEVIGEAATGEETTGPRVSVSKRAVPVRASRPWTCPSWQPSTASSPVRQGDE